MQRLEEQGWALWALVLFNYRTINYASASPFSAPPEAGNWLGTNSNGRDVLANLLYGFRLSMLFGLALTFLSSLIGIVGRRHSGLLRRASGFVGPALC